MYHRASLDLLEIVEWKLEMLQLAIRLKIQKVIDVIQEIPKRLAGMINGV